MTFDGAPICLESEKEDNYTRALNRLKSILDGSVVPSVILSDIEIV